MKKYFPNMTYLQKVSFAFILFSSLYTTQALTVSPARLEVTVDPGVSSSQEITIVNEQDVDQVYYTSVENFEAQGESGTPNFSSRKEGLASWIQIAESVTIKKGEKMKIPFSITVPQGTDAGGNFAAIFLSTIPPAAGEGEVSVGAKVGMLILLKVSGDIKEDAGVISFLLKNESRVVTSLPVDFVYRFSNNGNDRVKPVGTTTIRNMIGMTTKELNANPNEGNSLPNSIRRYELTWGEEKALPVSASFFSHVSYQMRNFALGVYFANLDLSYGTNKTASNSLTFFVLPWHLLVVIFIIVFVIIMMFSFMLKKYNKFIIKQARLANSK